MNDRFKFRVFDKETGKYYKTRISKGSGCVVYQHPSDSHCVWVQIGTLFAELEQDEKTYVNTGLEPDYVIEQCTGLKDKNGNLIYEGDIIHDLGEIEPICSLPLIVRWGDRTARFYLDHQKIGMRASLGQIDSADSHNYEIIGNIHEQAEQKDK